MAINKMFYFEKNYAQMKQLPLILFMLFIFIIKGFSQISNYKDSIEMAKRPLGGIDFFQHDRRLNMSQVAAVMRTNPEASAYFKKARTNNILSNILGAAGGFLVGFELGYRLGGEEINWNVFGAGIALIGISIPIEISGKKYARKAVHIYNAAFR